MKDEPPKAHIVATAVLSGAASVHSLTKRRARKNGAFDQFGPKERKVVSGAAAEGLKGKGAFHAKRLFLLVLQRERGDQRAGHDCCAPPTEHARSRRRRFVGVNRIQE